MFDINALRGYTYATVRKAFCDSAEICYEYGDASSANITSILTRIIQAVGRFSERWSSDALYGIEKLRRIAEEPFVLENDQPFDEIIVFGIRQDGVDHMGYVMERLLKTRKPPYDYVYPREDFRCILAVRARAAYDNSLHRIRVDFSLRDIFNAFHTILDCDLASSNTLVNLPFPCGMSLCTDKFWDEADASRIRHDGYTEFYTHELTETDLEEEGTDPEVHGTAIYGRYPKDAVKEDLPWNETVICKIYGFHGHRAISWQNKWYKCYDDVKKLIDAVSDDMRRKSLDPAPEEENA